MKSVVICGYLGFNNFGDEALLYILVKDLLEKGLPEEAITVLSSNPKNTFNLHNVRAVNRWNPFEIGIKILTSHAVFFIGGLFQDKTSFKSFLYYFFILLFAGILGKKIVFYGAGVGPINGKIARKLFELGTSDVTLATVRDKSSAGYFHFQVPVTTDPVWSIEPDFKVREKITQINWNNPILGVSMKLDKNLTSDHIKFFAEKLSRTLNDMKDWQLVFIPSMYEEDHPILQKLFELTSKKANKDKMFFLEDFQRYSVLEQAAILASCDVMFSMRYHLLLVPMAFGKPGLAITHDPKIKALVEFSSQIGFSLRDDLEQAWNYFWQNVKYSTEKLSAVKEKALKLHEENKILIDKVFE